jgi:hypothetical protein
MATDYPAPWLRIDRRVATKYLTSSTHLHPLRGRMDTFNRVRLNLLKAFVEAFDMTLLEVADEYVNNAEFRRRIDIAARELSNPHSNSIH